MQPTRFFHRGHSVDGAHVAPMRRVPDALPAVAESARARGEAAT